MSTTKRSTLADAIRAAVKYVDAYANLHPGSGEDITAAAADLRAALALAEAADALALRMERVVGQIDTAVYVSDLQSIKAALVTALRRYRGEA